MSDREPVRSFVVWIPNWPVVAWARTGQLRSASTVAQSPSVSASGTQPPSAPVLPAADTPVAIVEANVIVACTPSARAEGVRRGQRRRDAQAACPDLQLVPADPGRDQRAFEPLVARLDEVAPGVHLIRPGLAAVSARGPTRYYGGEPEVAAILLRAIDGAGVHDGRVGVADGVFTAEQAAYAAAPVHVVPPGGAAAFLAPLPITRLGDEELTTLLPRLGVRRLGDFAALPVAAVRERFGQRGVRLRAFAAGDDTRPVIPQVPVQELACQIDFETPLDRADQVGFGARQGAEQFMAGLATHHLACTELRVTITAEEGEAAERVWLHPLAFSVPAILDRVRWQLESAAGTTITSGVVQVRLEPVAVDAAAHHEPGLFGPGTDERVHHTLTRVQALLGHDGVVTASLGGGRRLADRQVLTAWGDRPVVERPRDRPWPGSLPAPLPTAVFPVPRPVQVLAVGETPVYVDDRGALTGAPLVLLDDDDRHRITNWAGPWPIDERAWDPAKRRQACRFQVVDTSQSAWLLVVDEGGSWWAEGRY